MSKYWPVFGSNICCVCASVCDEFFDVIYAERPIKTEALLLDIIFSSIGKERIRMINAFWMPHKFINTIRRWKFTVIHMVLVYVVDAMRNRCVCVDVCDGLWCLYYSVNVHRIPSLIELLGFGPHSLLRFSGAISITNVDVLNEKYNRMELKPLLGISCWLVRKRTNTHTHIHDASLWHYTCWHIKYIQPYI